MKKVVLILLAAVAMAMAESLPYTHDGFFLNISLGFGGQAMDMMGNVWQDGYKMSIEGDGGGGAGELDFKIGGRIMPFTILHATLLQIHGGLDVHAEYRGKEKNLEYSESMYLYGIGVTRYIYPYNFYFSGSLGSVKFGIGDNDSDGEISGATEFGFGFQFAFGKEWWVSENWGLGATIAINYGSVDEDEVDGEWSAFAITLMFSATFN